MTQLWVRAEQRDNEERVGVTPEGVADLIHEGVRVTVEDSPVRCIETSLYADAGADIAPAYSWPDAPKDSVIFGLKELPDNGVPLVHRHIMFGHAFKGQPSGQVLLRRFNAGGGKLYDLEYLTNEQGRRVAAFGYWAGYAGAAVSLKCWTDQKRGVVTSPVHAYPDSKSLLTELSQNMIAVGRQKPTAIVIGALGRVGTGASDLCEALGVKVTKWDMKETANGGPFPEILDHDIFLNCILARPGTPVFVPATATDASRQLTVIGDIACDPESDYSPIKVYDRTTTWAAPTRRVHKAPPLDVMAIDNLPSMLPFESSSDYARQLLPTLLTLPDMETGVWGRARETFDHHLGQILN